MLGLELHWHVRPVSTILLTAYGQPSAALWLMGIATLQHAALGLLAFKLLGMVRAPLHKAEHVVRISDGLLASYWSWLSPQELCLLLWPAQLLLELPLLTTGSSSWSLLLHLLLLRVLLHPGPLLLSSWLIS